MTKAIRKTAPEPLAPVPFQVPQAYQTKLDNGLRVVLIADSRLPLVSYRLAFLSGDINDPAGETGLTSAMASMLTEGTENYSSREFAEKIERLGASISTNASEDFTMIAASALSMYSSDVLDMVAEMVFRPTFPESELDLYRRNTIENLKFQRSQPNFLANEQVARLLYGAHPYSTVAPSAADIEKLTRASLIAHREESLVPNNAVMIVVGDFDRDEMLKSLRGHFEKWHGTDLEAAERPTPPERDSVTLTVVDRPGSAQSNIVLANLAFPRNHPDYFPALVMNQVLGASASSRVFMNLREDKGYTYGAYTRIDTKRLLGDFEATAEVRTQVTGDSLKEFFYELNRIRGERVPEQELADAKNFLTGVFPIRAETQEGLTNLIVNQQLYGLPDDYLQTYREEVNAVTAEEVQRVANEYIRPDRLAMVIVGDAGEILQQAREYADTVEVFDTDGNRLDVASFERDPNEAPAQAGGNWKLMLDFQGQQVPVTLKLDQDGEKISGDLETVLGNGKISAGKITGRKFTATASTEIQGQTVDFVINGSVEGDSMAGSLSAAIIPDSLAFTGTREK